MRFYCPLCMETVEVESKYGEVVSVYCLKHKSGLNDRLDPIRMSLDTAETKEAIEACIPSLLKL